MSINKYSLEDMCALAATRGGLCLSSEYESVVKKLKWRCAEGHEWSAPPTTILGRSWCRECAIKNPKKRGTIADMHKVAAKFGGRCISKEYLGSTGKLIWRCKANHEWLAPPSQVKFGEWCPECRKIEKLSKRQWN